MRVAVTGHRLFKLAAYRIPWIRSALEDILSSDDNAISYGLSGMASGVDLWFCEACLALAIPYAACIPFEAQRVEMGLEEQAARDRLIAGAARVQYVRNRVMVESCDAAIAVWDGNKGGTHNVVQQLVEAGRPFWWLNPVAEKVWPCF